MASVFPTEELAGVEEQMLYLSGVWKSKRVGNKWVCFMEITAASCAALLSPPACFDTVISWFPGIRWYSIVQKCSMREESKTCLYAETEQKCSIFPILISLLFYNSLRADVLLRYLNSIMMSGICYCLLSFGQKQMKPLMCSLRINFLEAIASFALYPAKPIQIKRPIAELTPHIYL